MPCCGSYSNYFSRSANCPCQDDQDHCRERKRARYPECLERIKTGFQKPLHCQGTRRNAQAGQGTLHPQQYHAGSAGGYRGGKNIKILGGILDAGTRRNAGNLCTFSHVQNVTFDGTVFKYLPKKKIAANNRNTHMIEFAAAKDVIIKKCKFYNNKNCRPNNEAIQIESIRNERKLLETSPDDFGKRDGTQCKNVTIKDCYFRGFNYGCGSNHLSKKDHFSNMKFIRNTFVGAKKYAICIFGYRNVLISGNKLLKSGRLYLNQGSKGVKAK